MPTQRTQNPSKKDLLNRLTHIREKLSSLRQEEDKINQKLSHEYAQSLSKCLMDTNAIEIDFNVLLGGILEVISVAKANTNRREVWEKSGQKFCRNRRREATSTVEEKIIHDKVQNKSRAHISSVGDSKNANPNEQ